MADATERDSAADVYRPESPLPEESGMAIEDYLAMLRAIGHPTRYRLLRILVANDELSATAFREAVDVRAHNFHYHLDELVTAGLVDKRKRRTPDRRGYYTYYRPTAMGDAILDHGIEELMRRERSFNDTYG